MALTLATITPGDPEIFASIQGEGPSCGAEVAFIRLSRCNLACVWCDTAYTWHWEGDAKKFRRPHRSGETFARAANQVKLDEAEAARLVAATGRKRLVITGGEPLLQGAALARMLQHLPDVEVEIETNGTTTAPPALDVRVTQYNVSPKLAHSGNAPELALLPERLRAYAVDPRAFFKFVVAQPDDVAEVLALSDLYALPKERTYLMPEGTDSAALSARMDWIEPLAAEYGLQVTDRAHIHLFGDTRGT
ncbi:7-carboxy-7-deazaguanine synthase QueE [Paraurantiacibacter namhicola]|uniref:7-carboxy-7-deazaguanine synthase n=1 Tax=Paraurantiacibacter namhicola TaxID=645517 RepID=A0A1C7DB06_9SPHN|nr:7-carboxy-7-deazaguanine synthase QueE [Paraurantiacibacter namhicola]ANU08635.1 7-carboxy-7-deazaguanine synthase [Paraurantiacibacter namhicola]